MITFVNTDEQVAVPVALNDANTIFAVYASWSNFVNSAAPSATHVFNGANNYAAAAQHFAGWSKVCRNDENWDVEPCDVDPQPTVPDRISARQIRLWLIAAGTQLTQIDTLIDGIEDQQQRDYTRVEWEYAPYIERTHPMVATFAAALGLTEAQVDAGFIAAANM